ITTTQIPLTRSLFPYPTLFRSHEIEIRTAGDGAVQLGVDDAAAGFDRGVVAEIVGGFQHEPCGIDGSLVRSRSARLDVEALGLADRKSTRLNSSHQIISYDVFC